MGSFPYPNPYEVFQRQFESVRRDEVVGVLLAFFLGCFGLHHFYVGRVGLGIIYLCFCWTGIPAFLGVIECFFMPGRVRAYNAVQAAGLAAAMGLGVPVWGSPAWAVPAYPSGYSTSYPAANLSSSLQRYAAPPVYVSVQTAPQHESNLTACTGCGRANPAGMRFCPGCGHRSGN